VARELSLLLVTLRSSRGNDPPGENRHFRPPPSEFCTHKRRVLPCAAYLSGEYGIKDLYVGVPAIIGGKGVERNVEIQLNSSERAMFDKSAEAVQTLVDACKKIAPHLRSFSRNMRLA
jgi:hypothetical protein